MIVAARVGVAVACLGLFGCSNTSSSAAFYTPKGVLPPSTPPSPSSATAPSTTSRLDGTYSGPATPSQTGGGTCLQTQQVAGFHVSGNHVQYSGFQGTIDPNGGVQMHYGLDTITGQFRNNKFVGQMVLGKFSRNPTCTYVMNLTKVGQ